MLSNCLLNIYDYICTFVILSGLIRETLLHCIAVLIGSQSQSAKDKWQWQVTPNETYVPPICHSPPGSENIRAEKGEILFKKMGWGEMVQVLPSGYDMTVIVMNTQQWQSHKLKLVKIPAQMRGAQLFLSMKRRYWWQVLVNGEHWGIATGRLHRHQQITSTWMHLILVLVCY